MTLLKKIGIYFSILIGTLLLVTFISKIQNNIGIDSQRIRLTKVEMGSSLSLLIIMNFIVPFFEELIWRYGLKFSPNKSSFLVLGIMYTIYFFIQPSLDYKNPVYFILSLLIPVLLFFTVRYIIKKNYKFIENLYKEHMKYIFILSVVSFAYSHFTLHFNYSDLTNILLSPIILIQYIIAGVLFGGLRIKFGFFAGVVAHIIWNLSVTFL